MPRLALLLSALILLAVAPAARAADPPPGATWTEAYFPSGDGTVLHADVLRPEHLPKDAKTPVLLTVSPYTSHSGDTAFDPSSSGPSDRFYDFLELGHVFKRGYTYVMADRRGFGGRGGCNDWGGPGERMDAKAAVEWAAAQPWSTGQVGMVGKSYDGWTGLMAIAERPRGLAAVLSMEPVYSGYRYLYMDGVRFANSVGTPAIFTAVDAQPGSPDDTAQYHANGTGGGACYGTNLGQQQLDDPTVDFWKARDLLPPTQGATTPLFLTQGYLESNTKPDGAFTVWRNMAGPKRAWFGQFDHVRGWEMDGEEFATGRAGFIDEAMRFLDHHVKRDAPAPADPPVVVQGIDGRYRAERDWPPADATKLVSPLRPGAYADDGRNAGMGSGGGNGIWSVSQPLPHDAHLAGEPSVKVSIDSAPPRSNLVVNVYDVAPDGRATMISRGAMLLRDGATSEPIIAAPEMYGQDWPIAAGHRIGVLVSGANDEWWVHVPTNGTVEVSGGEIALPFLQYRRGTFLDGGAPPKLRGFLESAPFDVSAETLAAGATTFTLPPALRVPPSLAALTGGTPASAKRKRRLTVRARRRGRFVVVRGTAPAGSPVRVQLRRGKRVVARRSVKLRRGARAYRVRLKVRRRGALRVVVTVRGQPPARTTV